MKKTGRGKGKGSDRVGSKGRWKKGRGGGMKGRGKKEDVGK